MANYIATGRTNYFRVTDEEAYKNLLAGVINVAGDISYTADDGTIMHGFVVEGGGIEYYDSEEEEFIPDYFESEIQKLLPEDEAFIYMEAGWEKWRYVTGYSIVVTKNNIEYFDIIDMALDKANELLGKDFCTQATY